MKTIKDLRVTVKYTVGYGNIEVPDDVYEQLMNNSEFPTSDTRYDEAQDWLADHIREEDAMDWEYEIDDIE